MQSSWLFLSFHSQLLYELNELFIFQLWCIRKNWTVQKTLTCLASFGSASHLKLKDVHTWLYKSPHACIPLFNILSFTSTAFGSCPKAEVVCQLYYVKISLKYFCISEHVLMCIGPDVAERKVVYWNRLWHLSHWRKIFSFDVFVFLQSWSKIMLDNFGSLITAWNRNRFICESQNNN